MDMPDEGRDRAAPHLRELALFLSVHLDRAPGVLWPEHDNPAFRADGDGGRAGGRDGAGDGSAGGGGAGGEGGVRPAQLARFTGGLAALTGLSVRLERLERSAAAPAGAAADSGPAGSAGTGEAGGREHLLIHQIAGAGTWRLAGPGEDGLPASFQCRLLPGEVLYVPARWSRRAECTPRARYAVITLRSRAD